MSTLFEFMHSLSSKRRCTRRIFCAGKSCISISRVVTRDEKVWIDCGEKYGLSILRTQLIDSENSSIIWLVWPNGWVFVYELSGSGFESSCSHLNFSFRTCFEQGVPWHSGSYRAWNHAENVYVTWQEHTVKKFLLLWNFK